MKLSHLGGTWSRAAAPLLERSQLRRFGHLMRMPPGRLPREVLLARPPGRRPRGPGGGITSPLRPGSAWGIPSQSDNGWMDVSVIRRCENVGDPSKIICNLSSYL